MTGFTSLVVDADATARRTTADRLTSCGATTVIEAASASEAMARIRHLSCSVCFVDLNLAQGSIVDLISSLHDQGCRSMVVRPRTPQGEETGLSDREISVLEMVAAGRSNKQIGEALRVSALTIKSHLARMAQKLGTGNRAAMVACALRTGLIT